MSVKGLWIKTKGKLILAKYVSPSDGIYEGSCNNYLKTKVKMLLAFEN